MLQQRSRMGAVGEQRLVEHGGGRDLVGGGRVAAALAEDDRRVVAGAGEVAREGERRVVPGAVGQPAGLHALHGLAGQLVGPGAGLAGGFVGAVEVDHDLVAGRLFQQRGVEVDDFLVLVVEEVDLGADDAVVAAAGGRTPCGPRACAAPASAARTTGRRPARARTRRLRALPRRSSGARSPRPPGTRSPARRPSG